MALQPGTFEFQLFFGLTIVLLIFKLLVAALLFLQVLRKTKETGKFSFDFLFSMFILMICLFFSRLIFLFYDYFFTRFNPDTFHKEPNVLLWRFAMIISILGYAILLFVLDKKVLGFKFKGIFTYIMIIAIILIAVYPVSTPTDFIVLSGFGAVGAVSALIIIFIFLYIAIKTPGLRKSSLMISIGVLIYAIGAILVLQPIVAPLRAAYGNDIQTLMFGLFFLFKMVGLGLFAYGVLKFQ
ncbi:MAG: hypothetical protein GF353_06285 [Candidatus Lokiarchaeota archaeon]|nr:hypothetical protein [Candidatus Lokiarchaeota archaeon]